MISRFQAVVPSGMKSQCSARRINAVVSARHTLTPTQRSGCLASKSQMCSGKLHKLLNVLSKGVLYLRQLVCWKDCGQASNSLAGIQLQ